MLSEPGVGFFAGVLLVLLSSLAPLVRAQYPPGSGWRRGEVGVLIGATIVSAFFILGGIVP